VKTKRAAPATGAAQSRTAAKPLDYAHPTPRRRPFAQNWPRVLARRRASRELDRLLGVPSRPNLAVVYGLRSSVEEVAA